MEDTVRIGKKGPGRRFGRGQKIAPYLFSAPFLIFFVIFMVYPFCYMIGLSFTQWSGFGDKVFIGLSNYQYLFQDRIFWQTIANGFVIFFMHVPLMLFLALVFAVMLNSRLVRAKGLFRTLIYLPNITNVVAVSFVFLILFSSDGYINSLLVSMGFEKVSFLATPFGARSIISGLVMWRWAGYNMLLMLAALQNISTDVIEAAKIDGASSLKMFFRITVPLIKPIIVFAAILSTTGTFSLISEPMLITGGNPNRSTLSTTLYLYNEGFQGFNFGYASAISVGYFVLMCILAAAQMKLTSEKE